MYSLLFRTEYDIHFFLLVVTDMYEEQIYYPFLVVGYIIGWLRELH